MTTSHIIDTDIDTHLIDLIDDPNIFRSLRCTCKHFDNQIKRNPHHMMWEYLYKTHRPPYKYELMAESACMKNDLWVLKALLKYYGVDPHSQYDVLLRLACKYGSKDVIAYLLSNYEFAAVHMDTAITYARNNGFIWINEFIKTFSKKKVICN